jgi:peptide/nickel transport system substrate-binding protein
MMQRRAVKEPVDAGGWNIFHTGFAVVDIANPLTYSAIDTSCTGENWPGWPCDPEIEALRASFAAAGDDEEKKRIATEIQARVMDFVTHIQYGLYLTPVAYRADLDGMIVSWAGPVFWGVSREE